MDNGLRLLIPRCRDRHTGRASVDALVTSNGGHAQAGRAVTLREPVI
jgi:hypothetical protein